MPIFRSWSCWTIWTSEDIKPSVFKTNLVVLTRKFTSLLHCKDQKHAAAFGDSTGFCCLEMTETIACCLLPGIDILGHRQASSLYKMCSLFVFLSPCVLEKILSVQRSDAWKNGHSSAQNWSLSCIRFRDCSQKQSSQHSRKRMTFSSFSSGRL